VKLAATRVREMALERGLSAVIARYEMEDPPSGPGTATLIARPESAS
jgi:hypothetical protein